jgi:hypothetical protein
MDTPEKRTSSFGRAVTLDVLPRGSKTASRLLGYVLLTDCFAHGFRRQVRPGRENGVVSRSS